MQLPITIPINRQQLLARLLCHGGIARLQLQADGRLAIEGQDGSISAGVVVSDTTVYSGLVILRMRVNDRVSTLVLPRAATGRDLHRRLRVWLKWRASVSA